MGNLLRINNKAGSIALGRAFGVKGNRHALRLNKPGVRVVAMDNRQALEGVTIGYQAFDSCIPAATALATNGA